MNITSSLRFVAALVPVLAVQFGAGCSGERPGEEVGKQSAPIIGGVADTTDTWTVGVDIGGFGICSGTLIAPNLVLTARHCVSKTTEMVDCRPGSALTSTKVLSDYPASAFHVYTSNKIGSGTNYAVEAVRVLEDAAAKQLCAYDLALLQLKKGSTPFSTVTMPPSAEPPKKHSYTALGFGCQTSEAKGCDPRGIRQRLESVFVAEVAGPADNGVTANDFIVSGRVCGGDSGGPIWNTLTNVVYGALSRGDGPNPMGTTPEEKEGCNIGIYTRTDAHWDWLQKWGKTAATAGGYAALPWMSATKPVPDAGPPDTGPVVKSPIGASCDASGDCTTALCVAFDGAKVCSATCSASKACPTGFVCTSGYCQKDVTPDAGPVVEDTGTVEEDAATTPDDGGTIKSGGCSVGQPPPRPQPWFAAAALAGLALAFVRRKR